MHTVLKFMENYHDSYLQSQRSCSTEFLRIPIVCFLMIKHMRYWLFSTFPHANRICQLHEIFRLKFSECLGKINLVSIKFNYFVKCSVLNVDVRNYPATLLLFIPWGQKSISTMTFQGPKSWWGGRDNFSFYFKSKPFS